VLTENQLGVRPFTFFEKGLVGHVGFADPFDTKIGRVCIDSGSK
jgi:5'-methylthioadenosine phosphorylase